MLTIEKIKSDFSYITALTGNSTVYHDTVVFQGHGTFCDLYFKSERREVKQEQVETFNYFERTHRSHVEEIERFLKKNLNSYEKSRLEEVQKSLLFLDVIEIPFDNYKYDLVLVCGKRYKQFLFFKKNINLRIEFKNGRIKTIQRKNDTTKEND